jgi:hypothetical protein
MSWGLLSLRIHFGVTGYPLFSLKGWNKKAQGKALGTGRNE